MLLASALTKIEKTVDIDINPRKMLITEIEKETYLWIQSIFEAIFEQTEEVTKCLVDLRDTLSSADYSFSIIIRNLGFNAQKIWSEELKKYIKWVFQSNYDMSMEDVVQNPHGFLVETPDWPNGLMKRLGITIFFLNSYFSKFKKYSVIHFQLGKII